MEDDEEDRQWKRGALREEEGGSWLYIHSTNDSMSSAKSSICLSNSFGTIIFLCLLPSPTAASRYSAFALSSSFPTSSPLYTLTAGDDHVPLHSPNVTFASGYPNPYASCTAISFSSAPLCFDSHGCRSIKCSIAKAFSTVPPTFTAAFLRAPHKKFPQ